jgi:hypothetical protein
MSYTLADKIINEVYPGWKSKNSSNYGILRNAIAKQFSEFIERGRIERDTAKENLQKLKTEIINMRDPSISSEHDQYRVGFNNALYMVLQIIDRD